MIFLSGSTHAVHDGSAMGFKPAARAHMMFGIFQVFAFIMLLVSTTIRNFPVDKIDIGHGQHSGRQLLTGQNR